MQTKTHKINRSGTIMVLFLILLPVLVLFVGFAVDYAYMQKSRSELRRATDLAAKAAAGYLSDTSDIALARQTAKDIAALNQVSGAGLTLANSDIEFGISKRLPNGNWSFNSNIPQGKQPNAVRVNGRRTAQSLDGDIKTFFGALYGRSGFEPTFQAVASFVNVDICLVLDRSSSMKLPTTSPNPLMSGSDPRFCQAPWPDSRWIAVENAVNLFTTKLSSTLSKERVGIVTFASDFTSCNVSTPKVSVDRPLTDDLQLVNATMTAKSNQLWNGMTDIAAGIAAGRSMLLSGNGARQNAVKFLIVLTDGQYTEANPVSEAQICASNDIIVSTITFSAGANQTHMQNVATVGNGRHYHADTPGQLDAAFLELGGSIVGLVQ